MEALQFKIIFIFTSPNKNIGKYILDIFFLHFWTLKNNLRFNTI